MPKRNRSSSFRVSYPRKRFASVPAHMRKYVQKAIKSSQELKAYYTHAGPSSVDPTTLGTVYNLGKMSQGVESTDRIGNIIKLNRIRVRLSIQAYHAFAQNSLVRVVLCKATYGAMDSLGDKWLLDSNGDAVVLTADQTSDCQEPMNTEQLTIVYDKTFQLTSYQHTGPNAKDIDIDMKISGVQKFSTDADDADKHNLRLLIINRDMSGAAQANLIYINYASELYFTDA